VKPSHINLTLENGRTITFPWSIHRSHDGIDIAPVKESIPGGARYTVHVSSATPVLLTQLDLVFDFAYTPDMKILTQGFQSWSKTEERSIDGVQSPLGIPLISQKFFHLDCQGEEYFNIPAGKKGKLHSHMYTTMRNSTSFILAGSIRTDNYTIFYHDTAQHRITHSVLCQGLELSNSIILADIIIVELPEEDAYRQYGSYLPGIAKAPPVTGWTSWYNYYTKISEDIIMENLHAMTTEKYPIDIFQIDDGWANAVGDWLTIKDTFPRGMAYIAHEIQKQKLKAGLWLAPFACANTSNLFIEHPQWIVTSPEGNMVHAGYIPLWGGTFYALDIYNSEFVSYLKEVFHSVFSLWGFDMVKLDFLYAAAMIPRNGKSRGMIMKDAMELLRSLSEKKTILGCGMPMNIAPGYMEYCRIGSDVKEVWEDKLLKFINYNERVSTFNSLKSTLHRQRLNGTFFINDPDVVILREENNNLTEDEKKTLFLINAALGGLIFTSDNVAHYDEETKRLYRSLFPHKKKSVQAVHHINDCYTITFTLNNNSYRVYANLADRKEWTITTTEPLFTNSLLGMKEGIHEAGSTITLRPHQSFVALQLPTTFTEPVLAGSTGHLFPLSELRKIQINEHEIHFKIDKKCLNPSTVIIGVSDNSSMMVNGKSHTPAKTSTGYIIRVEPE
jgi:alpha-galactosidase